jgi:hypothetical protein
MYLLIPSSKPVNPQIGKQIRLKRKKAKNNVFCSHCRANLIKISTIEGKTSNKNDKCVPI